jgi:hypothetical protein
MFRVMGVCLVVIVLGGCATYATPRYTVSADDVVSLRTFAGKPVSVGKFTSTKPGLKEIACRAVGPITTQDGEPFSAFIRRALTDELKIAGAYSANAPIVLTGNLNSVDFSSVAGKWNLSLTIKSSNGNSLTAAEHYSYATSYAGVTACNQTAQALVPAVQNLIGKIVRNPKFKTLLD